ncbi:MAG: alanine racemase, partial [Muribaculum sp.]|nr:alanine racemase [Muribaculum sp.]
PLIHSVDSEKLLRLIDSEARRISRRVDILLQIHVAREETKFGFSPDELQQMLADIDFKSLEGIRVRGIMGMASNVDDRQRITDDFNRLAQCYQITRNTLGQDCDILSMGMSHDYQLAIEAGSNMIRVGSYIFGDRTY